MTKIIYKNRTIGGYSYLNCPDCNKEICYEKPIKLDLPYCGDCKKAVLDADQKFCCWCGVRFER